MTMEDEIASRIKYTAAEERVLIEQVESLRVSLRDLETAIKAHDGKAIGDQWGEIGEHIQYIGNILNLKGQAAAKVYFAEIGGTPDGPLG